MTGVVSEPLLLARLESTPLTPLSLMLALSVRLVSPATAGETTRTENVTLPVAPPFTVPMVVLHTVPAALPSAHIHVPVLEAATKVVPTGTISVRVAPSAGTPPARFDHERV